MEVVAKKFSVLLAEDKNALKKLSVSNQLASYLNTHAVAPEFRQRLSKKLLKNMFSMNIDEATNVSMDKMLNVLVRCYDEELAKVTERYT